MEEDTLYRSPTSMCQVLPIVMLTWYHGIHHVCVVYIIPQRMSCKGPVMEDGTEYPLDVLVLATGYEGFSTKGFGEGGVRVEGDTKGTHTRSHSITHTHTLTHSLTHSLHHSMCMSTNGSPSLSYSCLQLAVVIPTNTLNHCHSDTFAPSPITHPITH